MLELIIFLLLGVVVFLLLWLRDKNQEVEIKNQEPRTQTEEQPVEDSLMQASTINASETQEEECCGQHLVCERDSLLNSNAHIEYYDDEELDILSGIAPATYTAEQVKMLEGVFYTLRESDVAGWVRSLQMRHIELTPELRDEALLIVRERRTTNGE